MKSQTSQSSSSTDAADNPAAETPAERLARVIEEARALGCLSELAEAIAAHLQVRSPTPAE